ncbi:hypothetical protein BK673_24280 [Pseudomonas fluorescens]|uniref:DUF3892 domain-containing protein n=1 Tax=Pseudomonas fluorescens TaxID=294 RepID=A0A423NZR2_PSEFL|nr:DUF3892 domain-containing protein [Pseudomonas fluorescens]ROO03802.1 hypothetical protein BK673_24280 [Pseudomonas fluorescens]
MSFLIYRTKIDSASGNIVAVRTCAKGGNEWFWVETGFIVQLIKQGVVFNTFREIGKDNWKIGAQVEIYDEKFLRTVANGTEKDNLESLPSDKV